MMQRLMSLQQVLQGPCILAAMAGSAAWQSCRGLRTASGVLPLPAKARKP